MPFEEATCIDKLMNNWGMSYISGKLKRFRVNVNTLKILTEIDLEKIFSRDEELGVKCEFRFKLIEWRKLQDVPLFTPSLSDSTTIPNSSVDSWIKNINECNPSTSSNKINSSFIFSSFLESPKGIKIMELYEIEKPPALKDGTRKLLVDYIIQECMEKNINLALNDFESIKKDIMNTFNNENGDYYFLGGKRPMGVLYNKYRNCSSNLRKIGGFHNIKKRKRNQDNSESEADSDLNDQTNYEDLEETKRWLTLYQEPWETVELKWKNSTKLRIKELKENEEKNVTKFVDEWPLLKCSNGFRLIDIDFENLFPSKCLNLLSDWTSFSEKAEIIFANNVKHKPSLNLLKNLSINKEDRDLQLFKLLHAALPPTAKVAKKTEPRKFWKPSIADSIESQILEVQTHNDIQAKIEEKRQRYAELGMTLQPMILCIEIKKEKKFAVVFDNILFSFNSFLHAFDICFKIFFLFNLKYPIESKSVYLFIQRFFYGIETNFDKVDSHLISFITDTSNIVKKVKIEKPISL